MAPADRKAPPYASLVAALVLPSIASWVFTRLVLGGLPTAGEGAPLRAVLALLLTAGALAVAIAQCAALERAQRAQGSAAREAAASLAVRLPDRLASSVMLVTAAILGGGTAARIIGGASAATVLAHASVALAFGMAGAGLAAGVVAVHARAVLAELGPVELPCPASLRGRLASAYGTITVVALLLAGPTAYARYGAVPGWPSLAIAAAVALLAWLASGWLTGPLQELQGAAARMAAGDLRAPPPALTEDDVGRLAGEVRRLGRAQVGLVGDLREGSDGITEAGRELGGLAAKMREGVVEARGHIGTVHDATSTMRGALAHVKAGVEGLSGQLASTAGAAAQVSRALGEVRRQAGELGRLGEATSRDVEQLGEVGQRAEQQLLALEALAGNSGRSLAAVSASLESLERSTVASQLAAAQAAELADHAGEVVREVAAGVDGVRAAVGDAQRRVAALGRRSDDIDQILTFIGDVAGRTNLLSLNASIIATQAGEHGKGFAVVAEQMRDLASQISSSTRSIGQIIRAVREDVEGTAALIDRGDTLAAGGVALARKSLSALDEIRVATGKGHESAVGIQESLQAHGAATREVAALVASVAQNTRDLTEALQVVGRSVGGVRAISGGVDRLAGRVTAALEEHAELDRQQAGALDGIDATLRTLTAALERHAAAEQQVREALQALSELARRREGWAQALETGSERLARRARALADRAGRFQLPPSGG